MHSITYLCIYTSPFLIKTTACDTSMKYIHCLLQCILCSYAYTYVAMYVL